MPRHSLSLAGFFRRNADFIAKLKKSFAASLILTLAIVGGAFLDTVTPTVLLRADSATVDSGAPISLIPAVGRSALTGSSSADCAELAQHFRDGAFEVYDLPCYVQYLSETLLYFAGGFAVLFIMIGGYKYLSGGIDEGGKEAGKKTIMYALGGLTVAVLAWTIVNTWQVFLTSGDQLGGSEQAVGLPMEDALKSAAPSEAQSYALPAGTQIVLACSNGNQIDAVMAYIAANEGVRNDKYVINGNPTIGVGHDCVAYPSSTACTSGSRISDELVRSTFVGADGNGGDFADHKQAAAKVVPNFDKIDPARQAVLIDMTFNMGAAWYKKWPKFIEAMSKQDYVEAYKQIALNSAGTGSSAYLTQVGQRARNNADIIKSGDPEIIKKKAQSDKTGVKMLCGG